MQADIIKYLEEHGAVIDVGKGRAEIAADSDDHDSSRFIYYLLSESMYVIVWDIRCGVLPDIPFTLCNMRGEGRFLSVNCCARGKCEFTNKEGKSVYLSAGEVAMDYYVEESGTSDFRAEDFLAVEIVMQVDKVITELPTLAMLKKAIKRMDMPGFATSINSLYFVDEQQGTRHIADELIGYCMEGADRELIIIKAAELGHSIGRDLVNSKMKPRSFASRSQARIAEDIYDKLTREYYSRWTVSQFADKYGVSESSVKNYFRKIYGCGIQEYQKRVRMEKAAELLKENDYTIAQLSGMVGYHSLSKFREAFIAYHGITPPEYRRNAKIDRAQAMTECAEEVKKEE